MLRCCLCFFKKRNPPLGYSKKDFSAKLRSPRASKPWRNRNVESAGRIDVTSSSDVMDTEGNTLLGSLTTVAPLGLRSPHVPPHAAAQAVQSAALESASAKRLTSSERALPTLTEGASDGLTPWSRSEGSAATAAAPYGEETGIAHTAIPTPSPSMSSITRGLPETPMTSLPFGKSLDLHVEAVRTYEDGPVPIHLQHLKRSKKEVADSIVLPRHINRLFHKIMGWSEELVDIENEREDELDALDCERTLPSSSSSRDGERRETRESAQTLRKKMTNLTQKMQYGVLLDSYEKDKFALEHQLEVVGNKMERAFLEWEGVHVLDQDASQDMANVRENKAAIVMETPSSFKIPVVNTDCCPGCGALLQDQNEDDFGYVGQGEVERYVLERQRRAQARSEYAQRMAELQAHWEKHGRHVGEEWLDFMTQEEFDAFYRDRQSPFVCHRCHALENLGVTGRRKVWAAPDFTERLRALKEKRCVIVLVVDITDFPGSMVYDLPGLISMNNEVILVPNKMDCVRLRSFSYRGKDRAVAATLVSERYVRHWVLDIATQFGLPKHRVKDVVPISAKRGWNVEKLIGVIEDAANLNLVRPHKPLPTYFVGVANVGKSSVINAIAHKLYVPQPPHPQSTKVYYSKTDPKTGKEAVFWRWYTPPNVNQAEMLDIRSRHDKKASKLLTVSSLPGTTVSMNAVKISLHPRNGNSENREQTLFYDTPGLLPHWHQCSPLTLLQMRRTLIRKFRNPQCFILLPGHTLFLGGLAAIDIMKGPPRGLLWMVYCSQKVKNGIVSTERSSGFWEEQLGRTLEPPGSLEQLSTEAGEPLRLSQRKSYLFECYHKHRRRPKADIYVCGLGWASFCVAEPADVVLRVRTLPGVVHGVREPLRYNDLRAFRSWPKLKRRFTSKSIEDLEDETDKDSVNTVVRLIATADATTSRAHDRRDGEDAAEEGGSSSAAPVVEPVTKAFHPKNPPASTAPFDSLLEELQSAGRL